MNILLPYYMAREWAMSGLKEHPQVLLGVAKLVRHYNDCNGR